MSELGHLLTKTQSKRVQLLLTRTLRTLAGSLKFLPQSEYFDLWTHELLEVGQFQVINVVVILVDAIVVFGYVLEGKFYLFQVFVVILHDFSEVFLGDQFDLDNRVHIGNDVLSVALQRILVVLETTFVLLYFLNY